MNTVVYDVNRTCMLQPFSGDKVDWIRLQQCSLVVGTMQSAAIDRNVAIQSESIVEKTIFNSISIHDFFHFPQKFDPLSLT